MKRRIAGAAMTLALAAGTLACAAANGGSPARAVVNRSGIVPIADYHQHIFGPLQVDPPQAALAHVALPAALDGLLRRREAISGSGTLGDVYSDDARMLDISEGEDHWIEGERRLLYMLGAYSPDTRFIANGFHADDSLGFITGVGRTGDSTVDELNFVFGIRRRAGGPWQISAEAVTVKPPRAFAEPITATDLIRHLDDAGIERAVVHSTAFWLGSAGRGGAPDEAANVSAANDWTIAEVRRYPSRLVAFCGVNPLRDYALDELRRCADLGDVRGMKLHLGNSGVDLMNPEHVEKLRAFMRLANARRMAVMVHLWTPGSYGVEHARIFLERVLPEAPNIPVQIAHVGGAGRYVYDDVLGLFADAIAADDPRTRNLWFDLATVVDEQISDEMIDRLVQQLRQIGLDRILFGADTPIIRRPPPLVAWATFRRRVPLTDAELQDIADNVPPYMN